MSDPESTRDRILDAATAAFAADGLAGARVDAIALSAGCNKQLLYHYFGNKAGLFEAVVLRELASRPPITWSSREEVEEHISQSVCEMRGKGAWIRMLAWEALQSEEGPLVAEEQRKALLEQSVQEMERAQQVGLFDPSLSPRMLLLALMSMSLMPWLLPQHTRIITGCDPNDPSFQKQYGALMSAVTSKLAKVQGS